MLEHNNSFSVPSHFIALPWLPLVTDLFYIYFFPSFLSLTFPFSLHASTAQHKIHINWLICFIIRRFLVCCWFLFDFSALLRLHDCQVFIWHYASFFFFSRHFLSTGFRRHCMAECVVFSMPSLVIDLMDEFSFSSSAVFALVRRTRYIWMCVVNL